MYSWKTIRITCTVLLLLPLVHLVYLVSRDARELMDTSPQAFQRELDHYIEEDADNALPQHPVVVVGGRRVRLWRGLERDLAPRPVLMRGLGDAIVEDILHNYQRLIGFYRPCCVVLLTGSSEFFIRDSKSGAQLAAAIAELVELDLSYGVTEHFLVFAPLKTPSRPGDDGEIDEATVLLAELAARRPEVELIDANGLLAARDGRPDPAYFRADGLQLNEHGYLRLSVLLRERLHALPAAGDDTGVSH